MKTLVVDDDKTSRLLMREILWEFGPTDIVDNGHDALIAICQSFETNVPYDLICLDIMMPNLDGHQVLQEIRKAERESPTPVKRTRILMVTALTAQDNIMRAYLDQCDDYITKPVWKETLLRSIRRLGLIAHHSE